MRKFALFLFCVDLIYMGTNYICPRCGNSDPNYIGFLKGKPYCRFCISMQGKSAEVKDSHNKTIVMKLGYNLSREQLKLSDRIVSNYKNKIDTLVNAVCGAGKTELVYQVIAYCLSIGQKVAFAVPRRDVVIELYSRIRGVFADNYVVSIYGGHCEKLEGDIVVLTTHQLYRYDKYFDLLILDEIDAFPFKNNKLLEAMVFRAIKGRVIMMSATPSKDVIDYFNQDNREVLELNTRFHKHALPVPIVVKRIGIDKLIYLVQTLKKYIATGKKVFVFAPNISKCEFIYKSIKILVKNGTFLHSKCKDRNEKILDFKKGLYDYFVTTAVLERGVTFKNLQVIVYDADNDLYNAETLIQIAGRVGRKIDAPTGEVIFLVNKETDEIRRAITTIKSKNKHL